jgi:hypothetical protein
MRHPAPPGFNACTDDTHQLPVVLAASWIPGIVLAKKSGTAMLLSAATSIRAPASEANKIG